MTEPHLEQLALSPELRQATIDAIVGETGGTAADAAERLRGAITVVQREKAAFDDIVAGTKKGFERHLLNLNYPRRKAALNALKGLPGVNDTLAEHMRDELFPAYIPPKGVFQPD